MIPFKTDEENRIIDEESLLRPDDGRASTAIHENTAGSQGRRRRETTNRSFGNYARNPLDDSFLWSFSPRPMTTATTTTTFSIIDKALEIVNDTIDEIHTFQSTSSHAPPKQ